MLVHTAIGSVLSILGLASPGECTVWSLVYFTHWWAFTQVSYSGSEHHAITGGWALSLQLVQHWFSSWASEAALWHEAVLLSVFGGALMLAHGTPHRHTFAHHAITPCAVGNTWAGAGTAG